MLARYGGVLMARIRAVLEMMLLPITMALAAAGLQDTHLLAVATARQDTFC